ncbi:MAG TPA: hypothetical protein EYH05_12165 [Anaerolineae bacterium]|nr:hypothetical protein [Anaerolineae bacterium]
MSEVEKKMVPAYVSFTTLKNFLDLIRTQGVPPVIDPSLLGSMSGSSSAQLRTALKYLGATDDEGRTNDILEELALASDDERPVSMAKILRNAYPFLFDDYNGFDLEKGTFRQFDDKFREQGATGATVVKAERFFLQAADYAQLPVSPYITKGMKTRKISKKAAKPKINDSNKAPEEKPEQIVPSRKEARPAKRKIETSILDGRYGLLHKLQIEQLPENGEWSREQKEQYLQAYESILNLLVKEVEHEDEGYYED